ncbi:EF-hand domain-containing protein [Luteimonas sp. MC1828]|uniref:EF-hand domain-containing protein n=1 Tax=Luteimonas sp. MC1828 TaxID=2799787 RepID=UPI0018F26684|nr:EF-hand domain-containing protein [Luteimonas sp. MC1828]MBJ7575864.1 EF-hand domain-containing protein [Luteimonas sp. MC1828]
MQISPKPLAALIALGAVLALPVAFAQSEPSPEVREAQSAAAATAATPAAAPAAEPRQLSWADVDTDGNGSISLTESAEIASLAQVFAQADVDADGELTADEYKAFVAKAGPAAPKADDEG